MWVPAWSSYSYRKTCSFVLSFLPSIFSRRLTRVFVVTLLSPTRMSDFTTSRIRKNYTLSWRNMTHNMYFGESNWVLREESVQQKRKRRRRRIRESLESRFWVLLNVKRKAVMNISRVCASDFHSTQDSHSSLLKYPF